MSDGVRRLRSSAPSRRAAPAAPARSIPATRPVLTVDVVVLARVEASGVGRWLAAAAPATARGRVTLAIVGDARVRALNRRFRDVDHATDVLSFPGDGPGELGEIVIAAGVARRQAAAAGHGLQIEVKVLALHGLLHLLGYDHERDDGRMARVERRLRLKGGLREGLIERGSRS